MAYKLISQLAHVELYSPKLEESVAFFKDVLGLQESARTDKSVYLRAWSEYFHHSLKLTEAPKPGLGHAAWRTDGPQELEDAAKRLQDAGLDGRWIGGDLGHGRAYQFWMPGGHLCELVWDVDRYVAPEGMKSVFPNRPQRQVSHGAAVRRIDHVTVHSAKIMEDVAVLRDVLGLRFMEASRHEGEIFFATLTSGAHNHDYAILGERPDDPAFKQGRYNHLSWFLDTREDELRALDLLSEYGIKLDMGPIRHGIGEHFSSYFYEPGGNYIELQSGGYWNYVADWETVYWELEQGGNDAWHVKQLNWGLSPAPEIAHRGPDAWAPSDQVTAREREAELVSP